jgi:hypothetical protein
MQKLMRCKFIGISKMKSSTLMDISPLADFAFITYSRSKNFKHKKQNSNCAKLDEM